MPQVPGLSLNLNLLLSTNLLLEDKSYAPDPTIYPLTWNATTVWNLTPNILSHAPLAWKAQATFNLTNVSPEIIEGQKHRTKTRIRGSVINNT